MARIRSIKPDFFRHEELQELQEKHPHLHPMLTFAGLWPLCDKFGQFPWKPRHLHCDILPFLEFDFREALELLRGSGFIARYEVDGKAYGRIPTWKQHQRITGDEAQRPARYPSPVGETPEDVSPRHKDETLTTPKKGRKPRKKDPPSLLLPPELEPWFDAIWWEVWPATVMRDTALVSVDRGRKAIARERFAHLSKQFRPLALYLAARAYIKNDAKVREGYVQEVSTFFGPGKATFKDYLEDILPWLEAHPSVAALTAPPESEEAFQSLCKKDKSV